MCQPSISENPAPPTYKFGPTHRLIIIRITIIAIAVAAFVNFEAIQITWLRGFSLFVGSSKFFTPPSLLTLLYIDCPRNFSTSHWHSEVNDIVYLEQRRSDTIDEKSVTLIYDYGFEILFSEWIRRWDRDNAVTRMQDLSDRKTSLKLRWSRSFRLLSQLSSLHLWYNALYSAWDLKIFL